MTFGHDTVVALTGAAALVNTAVGDEALPDVAGLAAFVRAWSWTGPVAGDEAELQAVHDVRPRLAALWRAGPEEAVRIVNGVLAETRAVPQLVRHDDWDWHLHATPAEAPLATRMLVEAAMAVVDVIRCGELDRLRVCAADGCGRVLVDLSRNRSRRFCDTTCGNRENVAAYRARRAEAARP